VIGVLVSGEGSNLQALVDAGLPVAAVASSRPAVRALERAEAAGVPETAATVHWVDEGMDSGPVIRVVPVPVEPGDTPATLRARVQAAEHRLLPEVVRELIAA
jgi:phosphoribosylglycinamide formyltransferase-1